MQRNLAIIILILPGIVAAIGIKLMRDTLFDDYYPLFLHGSVQFIAGLLLFIGGLLFLGGFIIYRDRKKQKQKNADRNTNRNTIS